MPRLFMLAGAAGFALSCGREARTNLPLRGGDIARVGAVPIPASLVADVARASRISARTAVDRLVEDALTAQGAHADGMERAGALSWPVTATLARRIPGRLMEQASSLGPPTDGELAVLTVAHALVVRTPGLPEGRAREMAVALRQAVANAHTADEFEALASAFPHPGTQVIVERLRGVGADGRAANGAEYDPIFVAEAFALRTIGDVSPIVETPFGFHTIYLVDRIPADPSSIEQRRSDLVPNVVQMRARISMDALLRARKKDTSIDVSEAAEAIMADATKGP
jgi:hypothetical protein